MVGLGSDRGVLQLRVLRYGYGQPVAVGANAPLGHPLGFFLRRRQRAYYVLREAGREAVLLDGGDEAGRVAAAELFDDFCVFYGPGGLASAGGKARGDSAATRRDRKCGG